jgi:hypothetical protein
MAKQLVSIEYVRSGKNMPSRVLGHSQSPSIVQAMTVGIKVEWENKRITLMQRAEEKSKFLRTRLPAIPYAVLRCKKLDFNR